MSIGPLGGSLASAAGAPLAQSTGTETQRAAQDTVSQKRQDTTNEKADLAAGIAQADGEDHETNDRDADGRRLWELPAKRKPEDGAAPPADESHPSKDATGNRGTELDLSG